MARIVRFREPHQPTLPLGHGPVRWDTLPHPVRERVLTLWMQLLTDHLTHGLDDQPAAVTGPALQRTRREDGR